MILGTVATNCKPACFIASPTSWPATSRVRVAPPLRVQAAAKSRSEKTDNGKSEAHPEPSPSMKGAASQDVVTMFKEAQSNIMELNRSRVRALNELKEARNRIAELEKRLEQATHEPPQPVVAASPAPAPSPAPPTPVQAACPQPSEETAGAGADTKGRDVLVDSIVLLYNTGWDKAYLHYDAGDGWTNTPGVLMDEKYEGYEFYKAITVNKPRMQFVTTNGQNDWDTPFGGGNYTIHSPGIYKLKSGKIDRIEG